jgi:hypothetical protein
MVLGLLLEVCQWHGIISTIFSPGGSGPLRNRHLHPVHRIINRLCCRKTQPVPNEDQRVIAVISFDIIGLIADLLGISAFVFPLLFKKNLEFRPVGGSVPNRA